MPQHHELFTRFKPFRGEIPGGYDLESFLGTMNRQVFQGPVTRPEAATIETGYPSFDEEYFEWIDILESVAAAKGSYTMIELGAGYGRWSVRAAHAVKKYRGDLPFHLIAVEAEPLHFDWMSLHFNDNAIDPNQHRLIHAAVSNSPGPVFFRVAWADGGFFDRPPNIWYGQSLAEAKELSKRPKPDGEYYGWKTVRHESGWRSISVPSVSLRDILKDLDGIDLIDIDIEGEELRAVSSAIKDLNAKVKRLHIGTHGKEIEVGLRQLFSAQGWRCHFDYSLLSKSETPWGVIDFDNGVQSWVNPRF